MSSTHWESPLGPLLLAATSSGLSGIWFLGQRHFPSGASRWEETAEPFHEAIAWLEDYFAGRIREWTHPLDLAAGTPFQQTVWRRLRTIPPGETVTYASVALALGKPRATRAVGAAIGRNPVSILIPCHRVVGSSGSLTGYAGGLDRKKHLLTLERR